MTILFFRNLLQIILKPGIVTALIPYFILRNDWNNIIASINFHHYAGGLLFIVGWAILLHCNYRFVVEGKGTLSPVDPTKHLVIKGLYRYSRNPMYVSVMGILFGESIFAQNTYLWIYSLAIFAMFNAFIHFIEELRLNKDFGEEYSQYCKQVGRWLTFRTQYSKHRTQNKIFNISQQYSHPSIHKHRHFPRS